MINTVIAIIYSIITSLPLFILLSSPVISLTITIGFLIPLIFVYRSYINVHIYDFEDNESSVPSIILIFLLIISVLISFFILARDAYFFLSVIPIFIVFYFTYIFVVYDFTLNYEDQFVFKVKYNHLIFTEQVIQFYMLLKIILLVGLFIYNIDIGSRILWILSFMFDLIIIIDKRKKLYFMRLYQDGFKRLYKKVNYNKWIFIIIILSISTAIALGRNNSILPYTIIITFLKGLSLEESNPIPNNYVELNESEVTPDNTLQELLNADTFQIKIPFWLKQFFNIIYNMILIAILLFIIYLLLYPLISPLFKKRVEKVTFKEYYRQLLEKIKEFLLSIFRIDKIYEKVVTKKVLATKIINKPISIKKRREINTLLLYYLKLVKWDRHSKGSNITSFTVNDFFNNIESKGTVSLVSLNKYFNIGFYSEETIGREKMNEIKKLVKEVIKNRMI